MKKAIGMSSLILLLAVLSYAQSDLPDVGTISDIKGKTKVYVIADAFNMKWMMEIFR